MDVRFFILSFLLILGGCLPEAQVSKGKVATQSGDTTTPTDPAIPQSETQWNYLARNFKTITIYASNLNNAYLTGYETEFYLSQDENFKNQTYCLVSDYSLAGTKRQMRTRVVPVSYYDFSAKRTVKVFRVDFNVISSEVQNVCSQDLYSHNSLGEYALDTQVPSSVVYSADALCPTCTSRLTSTKIRLFKVDSDLFEIPVQSLKLSGLNLIIDSNTGGPGGGNGTCSITSCQAQGYDCCLEEQCVDNAAVRPSAQILYPEQYQTAEAERLIDPLAWMRYPHIYYICPNYIPPAPGTTTGGNSGGGTGGTGPGHEEGLAQVKKDLACLENIKSQSQTDPFHQELLVNPSFTGTSECLTQESEENLFMHFKNVAKRLYRFCGCSYSELPDMVNLCPPYYYRAKTSNSQGVPTSFECQILTQETIPISQQVGVSSRSTPHRFYNTDGNEFSSPNLSSKSQEGDQFAYLDEENNIHTQENFGINSILGPMSLTLDQALPAKQVNVELDQMYLIRTTSGYYTPCPSCGKDRWHEALTAYPSSNWGVGLQAIGFSTQRDQVDGNITGGNYEDTIFGRACWVPPTMLPFTHNAVSGLNETNQRRARLQTQAVLYSNGYQRDWFGFNKGALIGSFDGVSWFAVGNGRLVKSTGKKLYLAINAPFADLATPSIHNVQITLYDGYSTAPQVDYDPQYHLSHSLQNQAGNCQANHMCQTDSDCITRLGWEYACADVSQVKTAWPVFDSNTSRETLGSTIVSLDQILTQKRFPSSDTKRCVYRGAGAVCLTNSNGVADLNERKIMTCAPNFYCASLASGANFSGKVSRFATDLDFLIVNRNHLFGQDANVLGRPLNYLGENISIPGESRSALLNNLSANHSGLASVGAGICRPGKALPAGANQAAMSNPFEQHKAADPQRRADYISQVASCNASLYSMYRQSSCPVLDSEGNYLQFTQNTVPGNYHQLAANQNACGLESISTDLSNLNTSLGTLHSYSAFREVEGLPLNEKIITNQTLARDACFRRAGAVCNTDLECSPNRMHAEQAAFKGLKFFGNQSEKSYWEEYLVCGQADPKPSIYDTEATKNYDQSLNRCCREVGKDLTTITTDTPRSNLHGQFHSHTQDLITSAHPGTIANNPNRYSRLATVEALGNPERPLLSANTNRSSLGILTNTPNISTPRQWRTLREANSETCCGGGWIRKFSDGNNDWSQQNRIYFDVNNFACLNSTHPILTIPEDLASLYNSAADVKNLINKDYSEYCQDTTGTDGSCAQYSFGSSTDDGLVNPNPFSSVKINTLTPDFSFNNSDFLFTPFSGDSHPGVTMVRNASTSGGRRNLSIRIPSYIPRTDFDNIYDPLLDGDVSQNIFLVTEKGSLLCHKEGGLDLSDFDDTKACAPTGATSRCCYSFDSGTRVLSIALTTTDDNIRNHEAGVRFEVYLNSLNSLITRTSPANDLFYLKRLGRLELSGIPQVTYRPLYCNDNSNALVPGIFKPTLKTRSDFDKPANSFRVNGTWETTHHSLVQEPVFSEDQFKCCTPLGKTTKNAGNCCSGYGTLDETTNSFTCSLPTGTNLMVYLNPLVSNEGLNLGLEETSFDDRTGEPIFDTSIVNKISQIGRDYCEGKKVRQGGVFGSFEPEPQGSLTDVSKRIYQITDSSNDVGQVTNSGATLSSGYNVFNQGYRWNHHLYCTE